MSVFISVPKKGNAKEFSNYHTVALISHISTVMPKVFPNESTLHMRWPKY